MTTGTQSSTQRFPLLGTLQPGTRQQHEISLPGTELSEYRWHVTTVTGATPGPVLLITAGVHGCEYPAIESAVRTARDVDPETLSGTVVVIPVVNVPGFWERSMFVTPIDGLNPNRMFPGDPDGSFTEQLVHAITNEFIAHADCYIDLHGGDMVEALVPFSICRGGEGAVERKAEEIGRVFGLENLLIVDRPVQEAKGDMSIVAASQAGVPSIIAEAGGVGQLEEDSVTLLVDGITRVMNHLGMSNLPVSAGEDPVVYTSFQWLYSGPAGMFYTAVEVGDNVAAGQNVGRIGSLFGENLEEVTSPVDGRVLFLTTSPAVKASGLLMGIGVRG